METGGNVPRHLLTRQLPSWPIEHDGRIWPMLSKNSGVSEVVGSDLTRFACVREQLLDPWWADGDWYFGPNSRLR